MADEPEVEAQVEEEPSLRDTIVAATAPQPEPEAEKPPVAASAATETTPEPEAEPTPEVEPEAAEQAPETPETPAEPTDAPPHWDIKDQEMFRKQTPEAQEFLIARLNGMETAHMKRSTEIAPVRKLTEAWDPYCKQIGTTPDRFFDDIGRTAYSLQTGNNEQRINILLGLARDLGVDFGQNGGQAPPTAEEDPFGIQQKIQQAVGPLVQQVQGIQGNIQNNSQAQQQQATQAAQGQIESFREAKGADGKLAHPYFDEVYDEMLATAQAKQELNQPVDLAQLYEATCWSNADVRQKIQNREAWVKRQAAQQKATQQRTATGSLTGGAGSRSEQPPTSVREALVNAFKEHS